MAASVVLALVFAMHFVDASSAADPGSLHVLILTDETDRMEPLAEYLRERGQVASTIVDYRSRTASAFKPSDVPAWRKREFPAITIKRTEVYSNVKRTDGDEKTLLLGYIYTDDRNGVTHTQATDGWIKPAGKGHVVYIQPGHFVEEFTDPDSILNQLVLNAIRWIPD